MAADKVVWQIICPTCRKGARIGSPYCEQCGTPLNNIPAVQVDLKSMQSNAASALESAWRRFLNEEQDPALVRQVYEKASRILMAEEEIEYIATANKAVIGIAPDCVVATNRRLIDYKRKMLGTVSLDDCFWRDVRDLQMREVRNGVSFMVETIQGWRLTIESLPKAQAWRLYEVGAKHSSRLHEQLHETLSGAQAFEPAPQMDAEMGGPAPLHGALEAMQAVERGDLESSYIPASISAETGPLPSILPSTADLYPLQGWQNSPPVFNEQQPAIPESLNDIAKPAPMLSGLDSLLSPFADRAASGAQAHGPQSTPLSAHEPVQSPVPQVAVGPSSMDDLLGGQHFDKSLAPAQLVSYQVSAPYAQPNGNKNGSTSTNGNGNGNSNGNGNGNGHTYGNGNGNGNGNGHSSGALHLPLFESIAASEAVRSLEVEKPVQPPLTHEVQSQPAPAPAPAPASVPVPVPVQKLSAPEPAVSQATPTEPRKLAASESPMRKLKQLKRMLDVGLITPEDYEAKKADILSRF